MSKDVTLIDADGRFGRMDFRGLIQDTEWHDFKPLVHDALGSEVVALIERLPRLNTNLGPTIGWWLPRAFQVKQCVCTVPDDLNPTADGFGWPAAMDLFLHKKAFLALCEQHPDISELGRRRNETRADNAEFKLDTPLADPFDGMAGIRKMLAPGSRIEKEDNRNLLGMTGTVIYDPHSEAYLDFQMSWRQLNRAKIFPTEQEAQNVIDQRKLIGCMTASIHLRVEAFARPNLLGSKTDQALRERTAEESAQEMQDDTAPARAMASQPRRRI